MLLILEGRKQENLERNSRTNARLAATKTTNMEKPVKLTMLSFDALVIRDEKAHEVTQLVTIA